MSSIADTQNAADHRALKINKVGIKDLRHPIAIPSADGVQQHSVATLSTYVSLPHYVKGTHMSRFLELLNQQDLIFTRNDMIQLLYQIADHLQADHAFIDLSFPYFVNKTAPISKVKSLLDYDISFSAQREQGDVTTCLKVQVPVTSLCPCSKEIAEYGAHNQRSHVTITATIVDDNFWIDDLIQLVEAQASAQLYGILKRPDEKFVTEQAYDNPKFVEDMVRDVATQLNEVQSVAAYKVESENFESIHNHSAYAAIERV